jgi:hypothetical protein
MINVNLNWMEMLKPVQHDVAENPFPKMFYPHYLCASDVIPSGVEGCNKKRILKAFSTACPSGRRALELTAMLSFRTDAERSRSTMRNPRVMDYLPQE